MKIGSKKGFTLIELLVVIAIIGILAVALLPTILGAPAKGRDAARKAHLSSMVTAIEGANLDKGQFPIGKICLSTTAVKAAPYNVAPWTTDPPFISYFQGGQVPVDPLGNAGVAIGGCTKTATTPALYIYCGLGSSGQNYYLAAAMELQASANASQSDIATPSCSAVGTPATGPVLTAPTATSGPWAYVMMK